jgi:shikimate kinase
MKKSGTVIFLDVPVDEIVNRISQQSIHRPLLTGDVKERINALREQRINTYKQAQFSLFGANIQSSEIIRLIQ